MGNDYEKSIGIWTHTIDGITHKIIPDEKDNIKFIDAKNRAAKLKDPTILTKGVSDLYFEMVTRSKGFKDEESTLNEEEKTKKRASLKKWINLNIVKITEDMMITYKWTTPQKLKEIEDRQWKMEEEIQKKKMMIQLEKEETLNKTS